MSMPPITPTHWNCRYSNTFFVALNNRIYFRDHPFPGGSGNIAYQSPTSPPEQNLSQVKPLDVQVVTMSETFRLDTVSPLTKEDKTLRCWTEGRHFITGIGIFLQRMFRYLAVKVGCDVKPDILFGMKRRDKPRGPVVWSAVGVSMRSDVSSPL